MGSTHFMEDEDGWGQFHREHPRDLGRVSMDMVLYAPTPPRAELKSANAAIE